MTSGEGSDTLAFALLQLRNGYGPRMKPPTTILSEINAIKDEN